MKKMKFLKKINKPTKLILFGIFIYFLLALLINLFHYTFMDGDRVKVGNDHSQYEKIVDKDGTVIMKPKSVD